MSGMVNFTDSMFLMAWLNLLDIRITCMHDITQFFIVVFTVIVLKNYPVIFQLLASTTE